ncbi:MAG TPA: tRNA-binding protein [Saprospiraceae bacterium]|nr:tRNA-binding protein [Saprospiraceae bacterium]HMQ85057.1 tRNA-binding protein [Saprospiraceae bacterium]
MPASPENHLSWAEFERVEMRVGTIIEACIFEEARKPAYKIIADFGEFGLRKTSAQITKRYVPEELIGKQIIAVLNFPPKQIANIKSEFLLLGVLGTDQDVTLLVPDKPVENGWRIA